jgi:hypothetical protein
VNAYVNANHYRGTEGGAFEYALAPYSGAIKMPVDAYESSGAGIFVCKASPIRGTMYSGSTLRWNFAGSPTWHNSYEGAFYYVYGIAGPYISGTGTFAPGKDTRALNFNHYTHPAQTPYQFCSNRNYAGSSLEFHGLQGRSWHSDFKRPTLFLDGHVKVLSSLQYMSGGGNNLHVATQSLMTGPYSSYELATGNAWGGKPAHAAGDYWIDEY